MGSRRIFLSFLGPFLLVSSCGFSQVMSNQKAVDGTVSRVEHTKGLFSIKRFNLMVRRDLYSVSFQDSKFGWVGGQGVLAKTEDGGDTWKVVEIPGLLEGAISHILFPSPEEGWLVVQRSSSSVALDNGRCSVSLFRTVDSGANWSQIGEWIGIRVSDARVDSDGIWMVGIESKSRNLLDDGPFAIKSSDGGTTWVSLVSSDLSKRPLGISSLLTFDNQVVGAVTTNRDVVAFDLGRRLGIVDRSFHENMVGYRPPAVVSAGVLPNKLVWMIGSSNSSKEGMHSSIYIEGQHKVHRMSLSSLLLNNGLQMSDGSVLLIGKGKTGNSLYSAALYSSDLANWSKVVEDHEISSFFSAVETKEHIWLVGSGSSIIRLTRIAKE